MNCKCGVVGELKVFSTFQYYYCPTCKLEIKPEVVPDPSPPLKKLILNELEKLIDSSYTDLVPDTTWTTFPGNAIVPFAINTTDKTLHVTLPDKYPLGYYHITILEIYK